MTGFDVLLVLVSSIVAWWRAWQQVVIACRRRGTSRVWAHVFAAAGSWLAAFGAMMCVGTLVQLNQPITHWAVFALGVLALAPFVYLYVRNHELRVAKPAAPQKRARPALYADVGAMASKRLAKARSTATAEVLSDHWSDAPFMEVAFEYVDQEGRYSSRQVSVVSHDAEKFSAYCHARQEIRTFRYERVQGDITDMETGEILSVAQWLHHTRRR